MPLTLSGLTRVKEPEFMLMYIHFVRPLSLSFLPFPSCSFALLHHRITLHYEQQGVLFCLFVVLFTSLFFQSVKEPKNFFLRDESYHQPAKTLPTLYTYLLPFQYSSGVAKQSLL